MSIITVRIREMIDDIINSPDDIGEGLRKKAVVRGGKRVKVKIGKKGFKMKDGKLVKITGKEKQKRAKGAKKASKKRKISMKKSLKKRAKSMKKRGNMK
jgi:hypothetical protein